MYLNISLNLLEGVSGRITFSSYIITSPGPRFADLLALNGSIFFSFFPVGCNGPKKRKKCIGFCKYYDPNAMFLHKEYPIVLLQF